MGRARIDREGVPQRPRQALEAGLGDVVIVAAVEGLHVHGQSGMHREGLKPFAHQIGIEGSYLVTLKRRPEHQERPAGDIDGDPRQGLIHRQMHRPIASNALHLAERLPNRLAERDPDVLGRVVRIDLKIARGRDLEVEARMAAAE